MSAVLKVLDGGLATTVQDGGRIGFRHIGVAISGALDMELLQCANALLGNPPLAACLEMRGVGPRLYVEQGAIKLALVGEVHATIGSAGGAIHPITAWQTFSLTKNESLRISSIGGGVAYLGIEGGLNTPSVMGSQSTYLRAHMGGVDGRALKAEDMLRDLHDISSTMGKTRCHRRQQPWHRLKPQAEHLIRVLMGPQDDYFTQEARDNFAHSRYLVTHDIDRMGIRLMSVNGAILRHEANKGAEIISDGITPGAIQVPANGQPILLLADGQTVGGYAKIATVIRADIPCLGHLMPDDTVGFMAVTQEEALAALKTQQQALARWIAGIKNHRPAGDIDEASLHRLNLISGVVNAVDFHHEG